MLNKRLTAARKVAACLTSLEEGLDVALARAAELNAALPTARLDANLSAFHGQEALEGAGAVQAALTQARRQLLETHKLLEQTKVEIGLDEYFVGDGRPKPSSASLSIVPDDASRAA